MYARPAPARHPPPAVSSCPPAASRMADATSAEASEVTTVRP